MSCSVCPGPAPHRNHFPGGWRSLGCSSTRAPTGLTPLLSSQPRGSTLPLLEGPQTDGVTIGDKGECVITPSTDLKFEPGLKGKNKLNYLRNYWLLIGKSGCLVPSGNGVLPPGGQRPTVLVSVVDSALCSVQVQISLSDLGTFLPPRKINRVTVLPSHFSKIV